MNTQNSMLTNDFNIRFYFTAHPGDMIRSRILPNACLMLVASAHWDDIRQRFRIVRPPADIVSSIAIDSGGFTAARRWGHYPWTMEQYIDFIRAESRDVDLDFCAVMDYACERGVNRETYHTNCERIHASICNDAALRAYAPDLPWLSVLQGHTYQERAHDIALRRRIKLLPDKYAGIGSVCGRSPVEARGVLKFYGEKLPPGVRFHGFGLHVQTLDDDYAYALTQSWDSYAWNWGRGQSGMDRPAECMHIPGETWSVYTRRLATFYWNNTIMPRLTKPRQGTFMGMISNEHAE